MTLKDIDYSLPNGFHDSHIYNLNIDFFNNTTKVDINIWVGDQDSQDIDIRETYRIGRLRFIDSTYSALTPLESEYYYKRRLSYLCDIYSISVLDFSIIYDDISEKNEIYKNLKNFLPDGYTLSCFFLFNIGFYLYVVAKSVEFEWLE